MDDFCHVCFSSGHIASECPNSMKKTKTKNFKVKSNNIKNDFSTLIASSFKENSNCDLKSKNFENEISVLKQKLEESEENLKIERIDFDKSFYKMQKSLMTSDVTIEELENEVVTIKSERDIFSEKLTCVQNNLSMSENSNFELEKKVATLNEEVSLLKQKLDNSVSKFSKDDINNNKMNFTSFVTSFKDGCEIFTNNSEFDFTDDELTFDFKGENIDHDEKFRVLLNDYVLKRKENSNFCDKINDLEKEVKFLKSCLGESEKKLEIQQIDFEENLKISQSKLLTSEKNLNLQRAEFLEKLKDSQCKFLSCEKARKDLEKKMSVLTSELEKYKNISHKFTNGSQGLDKLLSIGKNSKDRSGLGFDKVSNIPSTSQTTFVKASKRMETSSGHKEKSVSKGSSFQNPRPSVHKSNKDKSSSPRTTSKKFIPICHHCGIIGHIRPKCFKFLNDTPSSKSNFEKLNFVVKNSPTSKKNFNSKETFLSNSKFKNFDNNRNTSTHSIISHNKFVPTCHHCGCLGHIRPMCSKFLNNRCSSHVNVFNRFQTLLDEVLKLNEFARLRKGKDRGPTIDLFDSNKNLSKKIWVKKGESNIFLSTEVFGT